MRARISKISVIWYVGAFALVALVIALTAGLANNRAAPANANVSDISHVLWGDSDCDNKIDAWDVLTLEQSMLGIPQSWNACSHGLHVGTQIVAAPASALHYQGFWGDFDCDRHVQILDVLAVLKAFANLPVSQVVGCSPITYPVDVTEVPIGNIPEPGPISRVAIDTETDGNSANALGTIETCRAPVNGGTFDVDVVAKGIPPFANFAGGLGGFDFTLLYDPSQLVVTAVNDQMMLATGTHNIISYTEAPPDTDGHLLVRAYDLSNNPESGDGVLARITLNAIGSGQSNLSVIAPPPAREGPPQVVDNENWIYSIQSVNDALIRIGSACTPTPTPSPTPVPTPTATPGPGSNQCASGSPIDIPDNDAAGVSDDKNLADAGTISSMAMCLDIKTVWSGDLIATLTHIGTSHTVTLFSRLGGSHTDADTCSNAIDTNIHVYLTDDESAITESLEEACDKNGGHGNGDPLAGTFPPVEPFATFNGPFAGDTIAGDWKLFVSDNNPDGATAQILGWHLYFNQ